MIKPILIGGLPRGFWSKPLQGCIKEVAPKGCIQNHGWIRQSPTQTVSMIPLDGGCTFIMQVVCELTPKVSHYQAKKHSTGALGLVGSRMQKPSFYHFETHVETMIFIILLVTHQLIYLVMAMMILSLVYITRSSKVFLQACLLHGLQCQLMVILILNNIHLFQTSSNFIVFACFYHVNLLVKKRENHTI